VLIGLENYINIYKYIYIYDYKLHEHKLKYFIIHSFSYLILTSCTMLILFYTNKILFLWNFNYKLLFEQLNCFLIIILSLNLFV